MLALDGTSHLEQPSAPVWPDHFLNTLEQLLKAQIHNGKEPFPNISRLFSYHLYSVAEKQPLCGDTVDVVHEFVFTGEESLQLSAQRTAGHHAGLIQVIQPPHHWK